MSRRNDPTATSADEAPRKTGPREVEIPPVPLAKLAQASAFAILAAAVILVVAILPAEYGIDPTGLGEMLGFTQIEAASQAVSGDEGVGSVSGPLIKGATPIRSDSNEWVLQPDQGIEIKVRMQEGQSFVFEWAAEGGPVNFDMHGEPTGQADQFTSYWAELGQPGGNGTFIAPVTGTHGWFWRNRNQVPVTVRLTTAGFYEDIFQAK